MNETSKEYPYSLWASVLLLDDKIVDWKVSNYPKEEAFDFKSFRFGYCDEARADDYKVKNKEFIVNNEGDHHLVFSDDAPEWFRQWEHADGYDLFRAYSDEEDVKNGQGKDSQSKPAATAPY